jgi:hypothetical protein
MLPSLPPRNPGYLGTSAEQSESFHEWLGEYWRVRAQNAFENVSWSWSGKENAVAAIFVLDIERQVWGISERIRRVSAYDVELGLDLGLEPLWVKMMLVREVEAEDLQRRGQPIQNDSLWEANAGSAMNEMGKTEDRRQKSKTQNAYAVLYSEVSQDSQIGRVARGVFGIWKMEDD